MFKLTFGKLTDEGTKPVYLTNTKENKRMFCFHYNPETDNNFNLKPKDAITYLIEKAGYNDWADFWNTNKNLKEVK
jgi:hypothetical protein